MKILHSEVNLKIYDCKTQYDIFLTQGRYEHMFQMVMTWEQYIFGNGFNSEFCLLTVDPSFQRQTFS